jgi:hypothetical protein
VRSLEGRLDKATGWLDELSPATLTEDEAYEAVAEMLWWVADINSRWPPDEPVSNDVLEKLRKWIKRLLEKLRELTASIKAQSFSITGGPPIAVTITFGVESE